VLIKILYAREMFNCFRVFSLLKRHISGSYLVDRVILRIGKLSPGTTGSLANFPRTLEVKNVCSKHGFAKG